MPLIIISGYPSSGKTHRANQIISYFNDCIAAASPPSPSSQDASPAPSQANARLARLKIAHISDDTLAIPRSAYDDAKSEKMARATFASAIKKALGRDVLVVADGMNYIKGFRYQMYCEAKAAGVGSCCVHVAVSPTKAEELYSLRLSSSASSSSPSTSHQPSSPSNSSPSTQQQPPPYSPPTFTNLLTRYEPPSSFSRWDSPLFTLPFDDPLPPNEALFAHLIGTSAAPAPVVRPNLSTVAPASAPADTLYVLEKVTNDVVGVVMRYIGDHQDEGGGGVVKVAREPASGPGLGSTKRGGQKGEDDWLELVLPSSGVVGTGQMQRLRRTFVGMWRSRAVAEARGGMDEGRVKEAFVGYLNGVWGGDG